MAGPADESVVRPMGNGQLSLTNVTVRFSGVTAINGLTTSFLPEKINGLIGPNGAGKTTLLNAVCGLAPLASGQIRLDDTDLGSLEPHDRAGQGIVRGFQTVRLLERETVFDNVLVGCERFAQPGFFAQMLGTRAQRQSARRDHNATWRILERLGLATHAHRVVAELPFSPRRLTEIARVLVVRPKILLLDEPAAGLDMKDRADLASTLREYHASEPFTMIVIEHDVELVRALCSHCIALDMGRQLAEGHPSAVLDDSRVRHAYFGESDA